MTDEQIKKNEIQSALAKISEGDFLETATDLLAVLGYRSERTEELWETVDEFIEELPARTKNTHTEGEFRAEVESVELVFQVTDDEINASTQGTLFESPAFDQGNAKSFMFFTVELKGNDYPRSKYAQFTREINKRIIMPVVVLFCVENRLTIGFVGRRPHQYDPDRDVLEQVTLIKDIQLDTPHRAHLDILFELSLEECAKWMDKDNQPENFDGLLSAWLARLDTQELNKRFFGEIANWYFWAVDQVRFPDDAGKDVDVRNATSVIRLLTRLIFVWFIKEKGLVPDALFNRNEIDEILINTGSHENTYYKAILQNLFFATLNQEMNSPQKPDNRKFRGEGRQHYNITSLYRYKDCFTDPDEALRLFEAIPFLNGGLFECLDTPAKEDAQLILRVDGFSDREDNPLSVPNELFFSNEQTVDLNAAYGTKGKAYQVRGLINILSNYKFTIAENTPIEEEVALDPELLGKVFENLLAAYNPETKTTARKQTGSFYTPREIVNYMTDESLVAYLKNKLDPDLNRNPKSEPNLRHLLAYNDQPHKFNEAEIEALIHAIDTLKILDPACGSGAFPMGILHKLVFILAKLDPGNVRWKDRQLEKAGEIPDPIARDNAIDDIQAAFERNELNYGRKLYLIENCIYGVDIQPIAVQIAKLRFFISLIVDQQLDHSQENRGVRPLPNLETKFVAANTLLNVEKPLQMAIGDTEIDQKEKELEDVRRRHFTARTPSTKGKYRDLDNQIRTEISELLEERKGLSHDDADRIANWDPYNQDATVDWFDPEWMFGVADGFDVVIGNPPYKQVKKGIHSDQLFPYSEGKDKGKQNLYKLFVELSYNLCKQNGIATLIVQSSLMCDLSSAATRELLLTHTCLRHCIEFPKTAKSSDAQVFSSVWQGTCIYQFAKAEPDGKPIKLSVGNDTHSIKNLHFAPITKDEILALYPDLQCFPHIEAGSVSILKKIAASQTIKPLREFVLSIKQGDINLTTHKRFFSTAPSQVRLLRGRHVARYMVRYKAATEYFEAEFMPETVRDNQNEVFLISQEVTGTVDPRRLHFALTENPSVDILWGHSVNKTLLKNQKDSAVFLALLNSKFMDWYFRITSTNNHVQGYELEQLPIPAMSDTDREKLDNLARQIMEAKHSAPDADVPALENEIDQIVYLLYDLTPDEIKIVEKKE